jgi:hypothetical protein
MPRESSGISVGDLWPEIDTSHGIDYECAFTTATCCHLEALTLCQISGIEGSKKRKGKNKREHERCSLRRQIRIGSGKIICSEERL